MRKVNTLAIFLLIVSVSVNIGLRSPNTVNVLNHTSSTDSFSGSITKTGSNYITHTSISITSNSGFTTAGFSGSGTDSNPYILDGVNISTTGSDAISISGTTASFIIQNCYISANNSFYNGISLSSTVNGLIANNVITNSSSGILLYNVTKLNISGNYISNNSNIGLNLNSDNQLTIYNNTISKSQYTGLLSYADSNVTISYNNISYNDLSNGVNDYGYTSEAVSSNVTFSHNIVNYNGNDGIWLYHYGQEQVIDNTVEFNVGNGIYFGVSYIGPVGGADISNNYIANNTADGLNLDAANNNTIFNNIILYNGGNGVNVGKSNTNNYFYNNSIKNNTLNGFLVDGSNSNVTVKGNIISNNDYGMYFSSLNGVYTSNSHFDNNTIVNSVHDGIYINSVNNNTFRYNFVDQNMGYGVNVLNSTLNRFYLNSYVNNNAGGIQGLDQNTTNSWTNGHYGNYWSDYKGIDSNGDGIGDSNYTLNGNFANDTLPLMYPAYFTVTPVQNFSYDEGTVTHNIQWTLSGYDVIGYTFYEDGIINATRINVQLNGSLTITITIDGLELGVHSLVIEWLDLNNSLRVDLNTNVTIIDVTAPVLKVSTTTVTYVAGTTGHTLSLSASDLHPSNYVVYENNSQIASGSWNSSVNISISIDGLKTGSYNFTVIVFDTSQNQAQVTVMVTVTSVQITSTSTLISTSNTSTHSSNVSPDFELIGTLVSLMMLVGFSIKRKKIQK